jgi:hypothetical protein
MELSALMNSSGCGIEVRRKNRRFKDRSYRTDTAYMTYYYPRLTIELARFTFLSRLASK